MYDEFDLQLRVCPDNNRYVIPNGRRFLRIKTRFGLTREYLAELTANLVFEKAHATMRGDADADKRYLKRYRDRLRRNHQLGVSPRSITQIQASKPVEPFTLVVVSEALRRYAKAREAEIVS